MVMNYRSRTEIISVILQTSGTGTSVTKIMYNSYLSHSLLKKYIKFLIDNDMMSYDTKTHLYSTTEKGRKFLKMHEEINKLINSKMAEPHNKYDITS